MFRTVAFGLFVLMCCGVANGQSRGVVIADGTAVTAQTPQRMRVQLTLVGFGDDLPAAIACLDRRRQEAEKTLAQLQATPKSVMFAEARRETLAPQLPPAFAAQLAPLGAPTASNRNEPTLAEPRPIALTGAAAAPQPELAVADDAKPLPPSNLSTIEEVRVTSALTVEFPLSAAGAGLLVECEALQAKIRDADIAGIKDLEAEQEQLSESDRADGRTRPCLCGFGKPSFTFVASLTTKEQASLTARAFADARQSAERLATTAGMRLGSIQRLAETTAAGPTHPRLPEIGVLSMSGMPAILVEQNESRPGEMMGLEAGNLTHRVNVSATFELVERKK